MQPETHYARSGDLSIAYQVLGSGPIDLIIAPGAISHVEVQWEEPSFVRWMERLSTFARVIHFDKRGTGMSDRVAGVATLEERMDDIRAVMEAAGSERAALMGISEGGPMSVLFAATYPERTTALIIYGSFVSHKGEATPAEIQEYAEEVRHKWGTEAFTRERVGYLAPSRAHDEPFVKWLGKLFRLGASPGAQIALTLMNLEIDIRPVLPMLRVPTLVLVRTGDHSKIASSRYLAENIPGAKYLELPGSDHPTFVGDQDTLLDEVEEFLTGARHYVEPDRVLATVLFTDIASSTQGAVELGDRRWRDLLANHHALVRKQLERFRGKEMDTAGDGFFATFDGPARAIRCECAIRDEIRSLGIQGRAGLHTGECELLGGKVGGIAHRGAHWRAGAVPSTGE